MRVCLAFLLAMTLLQVVGFMTFSTHANVRLDAIPATTATQAPAQELMGIEKILNILAPVNVRRVDRKTERSFQDFSAWREQLYTRQAGNKIKAQSTTGRPRSSSQHAY